MSWLYNLSFTDDLELQDLCFLLLYSLVSDGNTVPLLHYIYSYFAGQIFYK